jgi:hypothetical protein
MIFLAGLFITVASLALCIPFIHVLNKYVPQLVGKHKVDGPWLNALVEPAEVIPIKESRIEAR